MSTQNDSVNNRIINGYNPFEDFLFWLSLATVDFGCYEDVNKSETEKGKNELSENSII